MIELFQNFKSHIHTSSSQSSEIKKGNQFIFIRDHFSQIDTYFMKVFFSLLVKVHGNIELFQYKLNHIQQSYSSNTEIQGS